MALFRRFNSDQRGAVAMMFGLAALPLVGLAGAAVDYSRAAIEQTKLQRATDAAVLTLVREPRTATPGQLAARAESVMRSLYRPAAGISLATPEVQRVGSSIVVRAQARVPNGLLQVVGLRDTAVASESRVNGSMERIEIALVLDNTGSMAERFDGRVKIEELRSAAVKLVDDLRDIAASPDDVRVSIVPFDTEVRLDAGRYRYRDWLRLKSADRAGWTGYIVDRDTPKDVSDTPPVAALTGTLYPALAKSEWASRGLGDLVPVQPLISLHERAAYEAVTGTIKSMRPRGNTNVGLGVAWGTATLTGSVPLDTPSTSDPRGVRRYMVVLTDGENTQRYVDGEVRRPHSASKWDPTLRMMNARTLSTCDTAKAKGIEVFTIRLLEGDADMLSSCASAPNAKAKQHYFDVQSSPQLKSAFASIIDSITVTRLTH